VPGGQDDITAMRRLLPTASYFIAVARRQAAFAAALAAVIACLAAIGVLMQKNTYESWVTAVYDPRDSSELIPRYPNYPRFYQVQNSFKARMQTSDFLAQVATTLGWATDHDPSLGDQVRQLAARFIPARWLPAMLTPRDASAVAERQSRLASALRPRLETMTDERTMLLILKASDSTPYGAQQLAEKAMDLFIQSELQLEADQASMMYETFESYLLDEGTRGDQSKTEPKAEGVDPVAADRRARLKEREGDLIDEMQSLRLEISGQSNQRSARRAQLEAELASLMTRLKASHPDVIAKRAELEMFGRGDDGAARQSTLARLRGELAKVRDELRRAGIPVSADAANLAMQDPSLRGQFLPGLTDRIGELGLERLNVGRQVTSPKLRTRLKVILPASIEATPSVNNRRKMALGFLTLGSMAIFSLILIREARQPVARDEWRIGGRTGLKMLAAVPRHLLKAHEEITPTGVVTLKQQLGKRGGEHGHAADVLLTYRRVNHALRQHASGNNLLVLNVGSKARSARFLHNLVNVHASDYGESCLVIDCNHKNPLPTGMPPEALKSIDLVSFLGRKGVWNDVRLPRSEKNSYDLVPAPGEPPAEASAAYHSDAIDKLFAAVNKSYKMIFTRALPDTYFTENAALLQAATDCLLCIDATSTTFADIEQALALLDRSKVRGYVLLGG
jgi:hypothetical protein